MSAGGKKKCATCGEWHDVDRMEVAFSSPDAYLAIPKEERDSRVKLNADFCSIDDRRFFVRGVIPVPVPARDRDYCWGVWAEVNEADFRAIVETWNAKDVSGLEPIHGIVANAVPEYEGALGLKLQLHLKADSRPFMYVTEESDFRQDQVVGVSLADLDRYFHYIPQ